MENPGSAGAGMGPGEFPVSVWPGHEGKVKRLYYSVFKTHPGVYDGFNETKHFEKTPILPETKMYCNGLEKMGVVNKSGQFHFRH